ncbi:hypothetical protein E2I00_004613, partial [Balaenoptera physalus]
GVVTAAVSLITCLCKKNPDDFKTCISLAVSRLSRDAAVKGRLVECLETVLNKAQEPPKSKKVQHSNAKNAILFETISLIIHYDSEPNLLVRACNQLGQFLQHRETNLRYLALESMCTLASSEFSHEAVKTHIDTVINALKTERDVSVRQRAADLLYAMCDRSNAKQIVSEMLRYLETADYAIREEIGQDAQTPGSPDRAVLSPDGVLKVAILAEKYAVDYSWYVDTILNLIRIAGDYVSEEVWYRVLQIVTNRDDVQGYAAKTVFEVSAPVSPPQRGKAEQGQLGRGWWSWPPADAHPRLRPLQPPGAVLPAALQVPPVQPPSGAGNLLVDVFSDGPAAQPSLGPTPEEAFLSPGPEDIGPPIPEADELLNKFVCRNNGVLFENQLLQIGVKSEFRQNLGASRGRWGEVSGRSWLREGVEGTQMEPYLSSPSTGRMYLFYGNKTSVQFQNFSPTVVHPGDLQTHILSAWLSPLAPAPPLQ